MSFLGVEEEEYEGCRALLMRIIRRAAHDWVLYRNAGRIHQRQLAHEAFQWLFEEGPGHVDWELRKENGTEAYSLLAICETLGLDPEQVRSRVRKLNPKEVRCAGRPPVRRKSRG